MLSLMVILSAYYLFTEDGSSKSPAGQAQTAELGSGSGDTQQVVVNETELGGQAALSDEDLKVIQKFEEEESRAVSSSDYFMEQQFKRAEAVQTEYDRLMGIVSDTTNTGAEEASSAMEQVEKLEQHEEKISELESSLRDEFKNVVVSQEKDSYKVVVDGEKLERSQADSIIQLVMNTLEVGADRVTVQLHH